MVLVVVAIAMLGGIGPAAYYLLWSNHAEERRPIAKTARASSGKPPLPKSERWVDVVKPSTGVAQEAEDTDHPPRKPPRKARAKHGARRGSSRATRPRKTTPRPASRVSITMYMAHW